MQRKPADVIADANVIGPGAMFLVDGNNNIVVPAGSSASDAVASGNLTSASGAGSTVQLQLGEGQATWEAQLTGTFSGGTTIAFQGSDDATSPTNWQSAIGYNSSLTNPVFITQISGPGPFIIRGPAAGYQYIQMVCTALHSGDNVAVRLIGSTGAMAGGGPVNIPDGSDVSGGVTTDAAVTGDNPGSRSAKLRGLGKILADVWDNINHRIKVDGSGVTQPIQQTDLSTSGTIQAAQPVIGTPVSNATIQLVLGQGQSTWKALLSDGGGGFTSGSTIVADKSVDNAVTWTSASFKVTGAIPATTQSTVAGPGPLELTGNAAGVTHVRIRCTVRGGTESIVVVLRASAGIGDIGLLSSIPAGSNLIGGVNVVDSAGTNKAAVDTSGRQLIGVSTSALFTTAQVTVGSNNSGDIDVSKLREISIDITMTLITTNLQFFWERKGADGNYYPLWQTAVLTSITNPISTSVGPGCAYNQSLGTTGRFRWVATGNASFTPNVYGK